MADFSENNARAVDSEITLIPYFPAAEITLPWYQDVGLVKQVDNDDKPYTLEKLNRMYEFLNAHGDCFYIRYRGQLVGDVTLRDNNEICIVISKPYQNLHIGRRCVAEMIKLAREKGLESVKANIYSFNVQSQRMFLSLGFTKTGDEWYERNAERIVYEVI